MKYTHNVKPTMCWIMLSTDIQLHSAHFTVNSPIENTGTTYYKYLSRLFHMLRPGQKALARIDSNTHIRRRNVETNKETHHYDFADIRYTNAVSETSVRYFAAGSYHLDHSSSRLVGAFTQFSKDMVFGPIYNVRYIYIVCEYRNLHKRRKVKTKTVYKLTRIDTYAWTREATVKDFYKITETDLYSMIYDGVKWDTYNPVVRLPDRMEAVLWTNKTMNIINHIEQNKIIAAVWALPFNYTVYSDSNWDIFKQKYIGPLYTDPIYNNISVPSRLYTQK